MNLFRCREWTEKYVMKGRKESKAGATHKIRPTKREIFFYTFYIHRRKSNTNNTASVLRGIVKCYKLNDRRIVTRTEIFYRLFI